MYTLNMRLVYLIQRQLLFFIPLTTENIFDDVEEGWKKRVF
jgi:hypothetical protein